MTGHTSGFRYETSPSESTGSANVVESLHVTHVTARYAPFVGGLEVVVQAHATELARRGAHVEVLTTRSGAARTPAREYVDGVLIRRFRSFRLFGASFAPGIAIALWRQPPSGITHVHVPHAGPAELVRIVSRIRRRRYAVHFHLDVGASSSAGRALPTYKRWFLGPVMRDAACVIALTEQMADSLRDQYAVRRDRILVLPNGVDGEFFDASPARGVDQTDAARPLRLVHVGRLSVQKNLPRLLGAMLRTEQPVELVLVGDGECRKDLERLAHPLGPRVRFVGELDRAGVRTWLRWADVAVSSSDREGMPLALLEAMATGLPVLCTNVPGSRELVQGVGLVVAPTSDDLASGLNMLRNSPSLRTWLSRRGRERSAELSWPALTQLLIDGYEQAGLIS